jgi:hypothetical protein
VNNAFCIYCGEPCEADDRCRVQICETCVEHVSQSGFEDWDDDYDPIDDEDFIL